MWARSWRYPIVLAILAAAYLATAKLGLALAFAHRSVSPVWAPTGIALAALLIGGSRLAPAVLLGAFIANVTTQGTPLMSAGIALGNMLEALVGATLVTRFADGLRAFEHPRSVVAFVTIEAGCATVVSAAIGVVSLGLGGLLSWGDAGVVGLTWWLGDATGAVIVTPVILLWVTYPRVQLSRGALAERAAVALLLGVTALGVFVLADRRTPTEYLVMPILLYAAFRLGVRETATLLLLVAGIAVAGTVSGAGPFAGGSRNTSLLLLQTFMGVVTATTLVVATVLGERRAVEERLRAWSLNDPLTGLANYRRLVMVLRAEIERSKRTGRSFSLLFLDLDGLKKINDRLGHLAGSRALRRLAAVLTGSCREVDTPARFGGDEFAVVLPEADEGSASRLAERVTRELAADRERPPISASMGIALYPRDGRTPDALIGRADRVLYGVKARRSGPTPIAPDRPGPG